MLQRIPARLPFRILEFPLGLVMVGGGAFLAWSGVGLLPSALGFAFLLLGPGIVVFGGLALLHAATEGLPEWVVGRDDDVLEPEPPAA